MLKMNDFKVWYQNQLILNDITLGFRQKQITAIVGPSGCGKTTLLRSLNRTAEMNRGFRCQGTVLLDQENIYQVKNPAVIRRRIGLVFQTPVALPLTIKENVLFGPRYYGEKNKANLQEITERCLTRAALWEEVKDKLNRPAAELSGGQKQRLCIARALAVEPDALLLDEPCASLDPRSTRLIEELLVDLARQLTVVIVTHNLFQAKRIAQETIFMLEGRVIEKGLTSKLFSTPDKPETHDYVFGLTG